MAFDVKGNNGDLYNILLSIQSFALLAYSPPPTPTLTHTFAVGVYY
jgi:hypothetical protein